MTAVDAKMVEAAYEALLETRTENGGLDLEDATSDASLSDDPIDNNWKTADGVAETSQTLSSRTTTTPFKKEMRQRSKEHLMFVAAQPCVICQRTPCDAHHLKFAQPKALGRKVSDEFTVPLCRDHHQDLHRRGNERSWWSNLQIDALATANQLWQASPVHGQ